MTDFDLTPTGLPKQEVVREWQHNGRDCRIKIIRAGRTGHYCGYVWTSLTVDYDEQPLGEIEVHGGLTYGVDSDGWLGFDCHHAHDVCLDEDGDVLRGSLPHDSFPSTPVTPSEHHTVWTLDGVVDEVESLAEQLDDLEDNG